VLGGGGGQPQKRQRREDLPEAGAKAPISGADGSAGPSAGRVKHFPPTYLRRPKNIPLQARLLLGSSPCPSPALGLSLE
jgi:hypothetical protein